MALTLMATGGVFSVRSAASLRNDKLFAFPLHLGKWSGKDIPMEDWVFESLETPYAILRDYSSPEGEKVNLTIVWYDDKEIAFHDPEACLRGVGRTLKQNAKQRFNFGGSQQYQINSFITETEGQRSAVFYFFISDGYITANQVELRIRICLERLRLQRTSAALVRMMTPVIKGPEHASEVLLGFLGDALDTIMRYTATP